MNHTVRYISRFSFSLLSTFPGSECASLLGDIGCFQVGLVQVNLLWTPVYSICVNLSFHVYGLVLRCVIRLYGNNIFINSFILKRPNCLLNQFTTHHQRTSDLVSVYSPKTCYCYLFLAILISVVILDRGILPTFLLFRILLF